MVPDEILYRCENFDWVPLPGTWGAVGYAPLLVLRQYMTKQFISATYGLAQYEFSYKWDNYKNKVREISNAWNQTRRMKRIVIGLMTTLKYDTWQNRRINDNIPRLRQDGARPMEEYLQIVPFELEIIKQDFENRNLELGKKIDQLEEEKVHLKLDIDVQK
ncbi:golgin subfamily A member 5-like [Gossypium australe]|uniref:Golgin subfamily A member 5-like n=1 Tax=Gossypium australe TaxID=47621 RepID=A0A5B6W0Z5_9ROSI|nr:golgin subfamily A member 5-like [Gossypium australe]